MTSLKARIAMSKRKSQKPTTVEPDDNHSSKSSESASSEAKPIANEPKARLGSSLTFVLTVTLALVLAGASYFYATQPGRDGDVSSLLTRLPESYALCTHETGKVYTVTGEEGNDTADCLLVKKDCVLGTGTVG